MRPKANVRQAMDSRVVDVARKVACGLTAQGARAIVLIGSFQRGDPHPEFDVDLIVIGPGRRVSAGTSQGFPGIDLIGRNQRVGSGRSSRAELCAMRRSKSWRSCLNPKPMRGWEGWVNVHEEGTAFRVKDDLSRFLRIAEREEVVITRQGRPAGFLIRFESEDDPPVFSGELRRRGAASALDGG